MGKGSSSKAATPAPAEPVGEVKGDPNYKPPVEQNRTEGSPLARPLLAPGGTSTYGTQKKPNNLIG